MPVTLHGHTSPETALLVGDYPWGFRLRTEIRYWIETSKTYGQRFCHQTKNPKTGQWCKPKASIYCPLMVMVQDNSDTKTNGHISYESLQAGGWSKEEDIVAFLERHAPAIGPNEISAIKYIRTTNHLNEKIGDRLRSITTTPPVPITDLIPTEQEKDEAHAESYENA